MLCEIYMQKYTEKFTRGLHFCTGQGNQELGGKKPTNQKGQSLENLKFEIKGATWLDE